MIERGQVWIDDAGVEVTVLDFAEFTCGWMVRVGGATTPDLIAEDEFRSTYRRSSESRRYGSEEA